MEHAQASPIEVTGPAPSPWARPGWPRRAAIVALATLPVLAAIAVEAPLCPTAALWGVPCPGCGLTRATLAAARGDFAGALHFHPLVFLVSPLYLGVMAALGLSYVRGGATRAPTRRFNTLVSAFAIAAFVLLTGVWLARFGGAFGGPAPVQRAWFAAQAK